MDYKTKLASQGEKTWPKWVWLLAVIPGMVKMGLITIFVADDNFTAKVVALLVLAGVLVLAFFQRKTIRWNNPVFWVVGLFAAFTGLSTWDASSGKYAIDEFIKLMLAYAIFVGVYTLVKRQNQIDFVIHALLSSAVMLSILTLDGATLNWLVPGVSKLLFGEYSIAYAYFDGTRMWGFWGNPNVFTTILGINLFLAYYLFLKAEKKWQQALYGFSMSIMAYVVMMCMSLGGIASLGMSVIGFLILAPKGQRLHHGVRIASVFLLAVIAQRLTQDTYVAYQPSGSVWPMAAVLVCTAMFVWGAPWLNRGVDWVLALPAKTLSKVPLVIAGAIALLVVLAFHLQQPAKLTETTSIYRVLFPDPGTYTLTVDLEEETDSVLLAIDPANINELLNLKSEWKHGWILKDGDTVSFEVPDTCVRMRLEIFGGDENGATVNAVTIRGEETIYDVDMAYTLVPESMVERLQGLRNNGSVLHRQQFARDCWVLLAEKPLLGHGMGGFEYSAQRVQPFRYVSSDPHNQFLQVMVEGGIFGFGLYIALYIACLYALVKTRKENPRALYLWGALLMTLIHGFNEYSLSDTNCLLVAYVLLALIAIEAPPMPMKKLPQKKLALSINFLVFPLLLLPVSGNIIANYRMRTEPLSFEMLQSNAAIDIYEKNDYKISYVLGPITQKEQAQVEIYLADMEQVKGGNLGLYLAQYYMQKGDYDSALYYLNDYLDTAPLNELYWEAVIQCCLDDGSLEAMDNLYVVLLRLATMNETSISPVYLSSELSQAVKAVI